MFQCSNFRLGMLVCTPLLPLIASVPSFFIWQKRVIRFQCRTRLLNLTHSLCSYQFKDLTCGIRIPWILGLNQQSSLKISEVHTWLASGQPQAMSCHFPRVPFSHWDMLSFQLTVQYHLCTWSTQLRENCPVWEFIRFYTRFITQVTCILPSAVSWRNELQPNVYP